MTGGTKISVAMAVRNGEKYLPVQLGSILPQLGENDELVISCDPSTDGTDSLIAALAAKDSRIKVIRNAEPGVTGNFNTAISSCTGDYIFLSDQDDKWAPEKIERVMRCFIEEKADLVIHNGVNTDAELVPEEKSFFELYRIGDGKLRNIIKPRVSGCCMAFTKRMRDIILPLPEVYGYDRWIASVCEFFGCISYPADVLIYHRLHSGNVTPTSSRKLGVVISSRLRLIYHLIARWRREKSKRK